MTQAKHTFFSSHGGVIWSGGLISDHLGVGKPLRRKHLFNSIPSVQPLPCSPTCSCPPEAVDTWNLGGRGCSPRGVFGGRLSRMHQGEHLGVLFPVHGGFHYSNLVHGLVGPVGSAWDHCGRSLVRCRTVPWEPYTGEIRLTSQSAQR